MSRMGSPSTAIKSASNPRAIVPICSFRPSASAASDGARDGVHRRLAALLDAVHDFGCVLSVRAGAGIGAHDDLQALHSAD